MRTLSAELLAAQRAVSAAPHLEIELNSRNMATSLTYASDSSPNRILRVRQAEGFFGGSLFEIAAPNGDVIPIAAQIFLRNHDNEFTAKDLRGYKTEIKWGFSSYWNGSATVNIAGTKTSQGEPYWVFAQKDHSLEGEMITELQCISAWHYLALEKIMGTGLGDTYKATGKTIRGILLDIITRDADKVFSFDDSAGTYADITAAVQDETTATAITWDSSDILYIGVGNTDIEEIDRITVYGTVNWGVTGHGITGEYWNGSAWTALSGFIDETDGFFDMDVGVADFVPKVISFDLPTDMVANSVNSVTLRWIRLRVSSIGTWSSNPQLNRIGIHRFWGLSNTAIDAIENDTDVLPDFEVPFDTSRLDLLKILLDQTKSKFIMQENFFKMQVFDTTPAGTDYDYDLGGTHTFFADARERVALVPNEVIVTNVQNNGPADFTQISNSSKDTAEQAQWGVILEIENDVSVINATTAAVRALNRIERYQHQRYQGEFSAPINIGLETWDWVGVTDSRLSITTTGRVGRVLREYNQAQGILRDVVTLGTPKWAASLSLNRALAQYKDLSPEVFVGTSPDLPTGSEVTPFFQPIKSGFPPLQPLGHRDPVLTPPRSTGTIPAQVSRDAFDLDAGPFNLGFPPQRDGYGPRKYNINPETFGSAQKEITVDILAFRDFQKNSLVNILVYQDSSIPGLVIENGALIFKETGAGSDYVGLIAPASVTASQIYTLPPADGSSGDSLITDGSGVLTWATIAAGSSGGWTDDGLNVRLSTVTDSVGIGIASPDGKLHVMAASAGAVSANGNSVITLENDLHVWLTLLSTSVGRVVFGDVADNDIGQIIYNHVDDSLGFVTNTTLALRIASSQEVGIGTGTIAPDSLLHVMQSSAGAVSAAADAVLTLETGSNVWLSFLSPTNSGIAFGDVADNDVGQIYYLHSDNTMHFVSGAAESVVLKGTKVGIGIDSPDSTLHLWEGSAGAVSALGNTPLTIENNAGAAIQFLTPNTNQAGLVFGDPDNNNRAQYIFDHSIDSHVWVLGSTKMRLSGTDLELAVDLDISDQSIYNIREETSDPTLASFLDGEIAIGRVGTGATDGRLWIESNGRVYRFNSVASYT